MNAETLELAAELCAAVLGVQLMAITWVCGMNLFDEFVAWPGTAWRGLAWRGKAWQGYFVNCIAARGRQGGIFEKKETTQTTN